MIGKDSPSIHLISFCDNQSNYVKSMTVEGAFHNVDEHVDIALKTSHDLFKDENNHQQCNKFIKRAIKF